MRVESGVIRYGGSGGFGWSDTAATYTSTLNSTAYFFSFNELDNVYTSDGPKQRHRGYPVRCLVY